MPAFSKASASEPLSSSPTPFPAACLSSSDSFNSSSEGASSSGFESGVSAGGGPSAALPVAALDLSTSACIASITATGTLPI